MNCDRAGIIRELKAAGLEFPEFEAEQICTLPPDKRAAAVKKRAEGYPLQYILGEWEFYGLPFYVGKGVLIPRPETELLAEKVLKFAQAHPGARLLELCAGSGCVCITVSLLANIHVTAVENSPRAFAFLRKNIRRHNADVTPVFRDALRGISGTFDLIFANPPYIRTGDLGSLSREVRCEPVCALDGGADGLRFYREIAKIYREHLSPDGEMLFETGYDQRKAVTEILSNSGFADIKCFSDLSGNDRVIQAKRGGD